MAHLTITLDDRQHRALKTAAQQRNKTIRELIAESLALNGITAEESIEAVLERVWQRATLSEEESMDLAVSESRAQRSGR
jgi:hypothetical protein